MANFGPLTAEIGWPAWGTPANFNGFNILTALLQGTPVVGVSQTLRRWTEGATYIRQGDHHVWHWPTFLVPIWISTCFVTDCIAIDTLGIVFWHYSGLGRVQNWTCWTFGSRYFQTQDALPVNTVSEYCVVKFCDCVTLLLHFAWVADDAKCIVVIVCLSVCLSISLSVPCHTSGRRCNLGIVGGAP